MKPELSIDVHGSPIPRNDRDQYQAMGSVYGLKTEHLQPTTPEPVTPATTKTKSRWIARLKSWLPVVTWTKPKSEPLTPLA